MDEHDASADAGSSPKTSGVARLLQIKLQSTSRRFGKRLAEADPFPTLCHKASPTTGSSTAKRVPALRSGLRHHASTGSLLNFILVPLNCRDATTPCLWNHDVQEASRPSPHRIDTAYRPQSWPKMLRSSARMTRWLSCTIAVGSRPFRQVPQNSKVHRSVC